MKKVKVTMCTGTTCFVMGASEFLLLREQLPPELRDAVEIEGTHCLDLCKNRNYGAAPYVDIDGEIIGAADVHTLLDIITRKARDQ